MKLKGSKLYLLVVMMVVLAVSLFQYGSKINAPLLRHFYRDYCDAACVKLDSTRKHLYRVQTPACIIPNIGPSHSTLIKFREKEPMKPVCSEKEPLTEASGLMLRFYEDRYWQYGVVSPKDFNCSYRGIVRIQQDPNKYNGRADTQSKYTDVNISITEAFSPIEEDGIYVICTKYNNNTYEVIYKNVHYFIQPKRVKEKRKLQMKKGPRGSRPDQLSVVIMGIDAVSRNNFLRHLPKCYRYLTQDLHAIDMRGFTKVGGNTYPNAVATLMGMSDNEVSKHSCMPQHGSKFDDCPLIWKNFSNNGYATALAEDAQWMGIFHYTRTGFVIQPTDYYSTPFFYVSEATIGHTAGMGGYNGNLCQGGKLSLNVIYDYSLAIAEALQDMPYFAFSWASATTHDSFGLSSAADQPTLEYLQKLHDGGYLEHTILFLMSDHGFHYTGAVKDFYGGMMENHMPFLMVVFPHWFRDQYPDIVKNMNINSRRLTSHYDIYATLQDINNRAYTNLNNSYVRKNHGQSLFQEISPKRTCDDAGIPGIYCVCQNTTQADPNDPYLLGSINHTISELNQRLSRFKECQNISLGKVLGGTVNSPNIYNTPPKLESVVITYDVKFTIQPGGAEIASSVLYDNTTRTYELVSEVSRLNAIGQHSQCIHDENYNKFCHCKQ